MENSDVAQVLAEMADLLDITGGNAFKARAYRQAAQMVELLPGPVAELWRQGKLMELPSIGVQIAKHIEELLDQGHFREHDGLRSRVPPGLLELLKIESVGPKTVALAWKQLQIKDLNYFYAACQDGSLEKLPRMGPKRVQAMVRALERYRARKGRIPLHRALATAESIVQRLRHAPGVFQAEVAGSIRRRKETVGDIDLLVSALDPEPIIRAFRQVPEIQEVTATGPTKCTARLRNGLQTDLRILPRESFGAALYYFTGSKAHNIEIRTRAVHQGFKLSEYGIFDREGHRLGGSTEEEIFRLLDLSWIPPELRENTGEIQAAERGSLPALIEESDIHGDLHVHSKESTDARSSLEDLSEEAARLGREYLAITDHSQSRPLGLSTDALRQHARHIREFELGHFHAPRLLTGIEVDILPEGRLDLPLDVLSDLDCVVASVHSHFTDSPERMTDRIIRALRTGVVDVLGHPTGRQIGIRDAYGFDFDAVLEVAREEGVALEINAMPDRLDLNDRYCREAKEAGVAVAISTDAHHVSHLGNLRYGLWVARRGWLGREDVINSLSLVRLQKRLHSRRRDIGGEASLHS